MKNYEIYGVVLKNYRLKANKTVEESAKLCGHSKTWLSDIERGTRRIAFGDALKLLDYYEADLSKVQKDIETLLRYK